MKWLIFTLLSTGQVKDIDHKVFKTYNECESYLSEHIGSKPRSCFTSYAKFKRGKKK